MPELNQIDTVRVIHADGTEGVAKLRVIGVAKVPAVPEPHDFQKAREEAAKAETLPDKQ